MANFFSLGCKSKKVTKQVVKPKIPQPPKGIVIQSAINSTLVKIEEEQNQKPEQQNGCVCF